MKLSPVPPPAASNFNSRKGFTFWLTGRVAILKGVSLPLFGKVIEDLGNPLLDVVLEPGDILYVAQL